MELREYSAENGMLPTIIAISLGWFWLQLFNVMRWYREVSDSRVHEKGLQDYQDSPPISAWRLGLVLSP